MTNEKQSRDNIKIFKEIVFRNIHLAEQWMARCTNECYLQDEKDFMKDVPLEERYKIKGFPTPTMKTFYVSYGYLQAKKYISLLAIAQTGREINKYTELRDEHLMISKLNRYLIENGINSNFLKIMDDEYNDLMAITEDIRRNRIDNNITIKKLLREVL